MEAYPAGIAEQIQEQVISRKHRFAVPVHRRRRFDCAALSAELGWNKANTRSVLHIAD